MRTQDEALINVIKAYELEHHDQLEADGFDTRSAYDAPLLGKEPSYSKLIQGSQTSGSGSSGSGGKISIYVLNGYAYTLIPTHMCTYTHIQHIRIYTRTSTHTPVRHVHVHITLYSVKYFFMILKITENNQYGEELFEHVLRRVST